MKPEKSVEELLRWRLEQAKSEAPSAPSASHLLERARPWWEKSPEVFLSRVERLNRMELGRDRPATEPNRNTCRYPLPALIIRGVEEAEGLVQVQEFNIRNDSLNFRFRLEPPLPQEEPSLELTFISDKSARPVLLAAASALVEGDYFLDTLLPPEVALEWAHLKETDHLPFRLILRSAINPEGRALD